jgi:hypothetical protein
MTDRERDRAVEEMADELYRQLVGREPDETTAAKIEGQLGFTDDE